MESDTTERLNNNQNSYLYQVGANGVEGRVGGVSSERHKNKQLTDSPTDPLWEERWSAGTHSDRHPLTYRGAGHWGEGGCASWGRGMSVKGQ